MTINSVVLNQCCVQGSVTTPNGCLGCSSVGAAHHSGLLGCSPLGCLPVSAAHKSWCLPVTSFDFSPVFFARQWCSSVLPACQSPVWAAHQAWFLASLCWSPVCCLPDTSFGLSPVLFLRHCWSPHLAAWAAQQSWMLDSYGCCAVCASHQSVCFRVASLTCSPVCVLSSY